MSFYSKNKRISKDYWTQQLNETSIHKDSPYCTNCHKYGHIYKKCQYPQESYGIMACRFATPFELFLWLWKHQKWDLFHLEPFPLHYPDHWNSYTKQKEILMICRKHSFSYIEFVRGKYNLDDTVYLTYLMKTMTEEEIGKIMNMDFETAWRDMWSTPIEKTYQQLTEHREFLPSKKKWESLKEGTWIQKMGTRYFMKLHDWIPSIRLEKVLEPEWGYPKGRKDHKEIPIETAKREFTEESNLPLSSLTFMSNILTGMDSQFSFLEDYYGSNHIHYHLYYYPALYIPCEFEEWYKGNYEKLMEWMKKPIEECIKEEEWLWKSWKEEIQSPKETLSKLEISQIQWIPIELGQHKIRHYELHHHCMYSFMKNCFDSWLC